MNVPGVATPVDLYRVDGASTAIVVLHGGGGSPRGMTHQVALSSSPEPDAGTIDWAWLRERKVMVAFPAGGIRRGTVGSWNNGGDNDDTAYLVGLAAQLRSLGAQKVYLTGHSAGGMMASRVWCSDAAEAFDAYVPVSGPPLETSAQDCSPATPQPVLAIIGSEDEAIIAGSPWDAPAWRMFGNNPARSNYSRVLVSEPATLARRAELTCGEPPTGPETAGARTTWSACGGRVGLIRVEGAVHAVNTIGDGLAPGNPKAVLQQVLDFGARQ